MRAEGFFDVERGTEVCTMSLHGLEAGIGLGMSGFSKTILHGTFEVGQHCGGWRKC